MDNNRLDPSLLTVGKLFDASDVVYVVPVYQRNYAWQAGQIEQLLRDVLDAMDNTDRDPTSGGGGGYFLGNLVVTLLHGTPACFEVIDGQQRLTTLYLLLTCLAGLIGVDYGHQGRLRYESRPRATETLRRLPAGFPHQSVAQTHAPDTEDAGIHQGYTVIRQFMAQNVQDRERLVRFAAFLRGSVTVVRASLPRGMDFNRYFEVMNTRGEQLQQTDIVKARLMRHLGDDEQACFAWIWDACSDMDSYVQMSLTRGDTALRSKIFGEQWSSPGRADFDLLLEARRPVTTAGARTSASLTLDEALARYARTDVTGSSEDHDNVRFSSIIDFPVFLLHVLSVMTGKGRKPEPGASHEDDGESGESLDDKRLIRRFDAVLRNRDDAGRREWVRDFASGLLRCRTLFDTFVIKREYTATNRDEGDWSLRCLEKSGPSKQPTARYRNTFPRSGSDPGNDLDARPADSNLLMLQSMLRVTYTSPRTMHWITRLLKILDGNVHDRLTESDLAASLRSYARDRVRVAFPLEKEPCGFAISRIVFTYLDYLLWEKSRDREFRFSFRNSIEHFYPQNPDRQQSGAKLSPQWLHRLGNLALVSVGANSKFGNSMPGAKVVNFRGTIWKQSPKLDLMAEITVATPDRDWGDSQVKAHHEAMVRLLREDLAVDSLEHGARSRTHGYSVP